MFARMRAARPILGGDKRPLHVDPGNAVAYSRIGTAGLGDSAQGPQHLVVALSADCGAESRDALRLQAPHDARHDTGINVETVEVKARVAVDLNVHEPGQ